MLLKERQIDQYLWDEEIIARKMVFLSGPRQVGKTTYARNLIGDRFAGSYHNWDHPTVRRSYASDPFFFLPTPSSSKPALVIFDEIHKRPHWKDILKGIYDSLDPSIRLLVTGSARLEWFRKSGDSLVGRYSHFHLLPASLSELLRSDVNHLWLSNEREWKDPWRSLLSLLSLEQKEAGSLFETLFQFGGFPEPLTRGSERFLRKWKTDYLSLILREDLRDLAHIKTIETVERLMDLLPERIGSPLSINALVPLLETTFPTIKNYLMQLEKLWVLFSIPPWSKRLARTLRKEKKFYFVNWVYASEEANRFENLVAGTLLRACLSWEDRGLGKAELLYVKMLDGREVDFLIALNGQPALLVECKLSDTEPSRFLQNLSQSLGVPFVQVVRRSGIRRIEKQFAVVSAPVFLSAFP
ncbi:MAG: ATP-binding protein [Elusimicrobia bacterium]|nr:ATP-binding protein [Elusimicrobiota bacterium]